MQLNSFYLIFEKASSTASSSALSVVGMYTYINSDLPVDFNALVTHTRTSPTIRSLVLLFVSLDSLHQFLNPFVEVLALATHTINLVFAYDEKKEHRAVGVDPVTLDPNGV